MASPEVRDFASIILNHSPQPYTFNFSPFLRQVHHHGLPADRPICKAYATGHCPNGTKCLDRHVSDPTAAKSGGGPPPSGLNSLVCKHWLRGLCKKGEQCEFLHEYNLRKMPECGWISLLQMTTKIVEEIETGIETGMMEDIATAVAESGEAEEIGGSEDEAIDARLDLGTRLHRSRILLRVSTALSTVDEWILI
ncbi:hypothetical protein SAPIO_CDS6070 [Scedosporium apiospermum]|uniref:mRNA 3'-end-processing protein n=1 Tax=Pseudallescheria apiosperma TaxID=563466 RepID=A0A084G4F9_PSEDA|nr:uncharacterized protein SAPIO_CDS6070 [Scedosporium apiospermum]KEZ42221.1 hypothetical protein SAPIO_CDS6070 [Scedosporium apiospermum]